jgi:hypothetical protein
MPEIHIEDDVFEGLQTLAKPFVDTPSTVIRRLLEDRKVLSKSGDGEPSSLDAASEANVASKGRFDPSNKGQDRSTCLTVQQVCETFLLYVLLTEFEGKAKKAEATQAVVKLMTTHGFFKPADLEQESSGETKAEYIVSWTRNALKDTGMISQDSQRGIWELTSKGWFKASETILPKMI